MYRPKKERKAERKEKKEIKISLVFVFLRLT